MKEPTRLDYRTELAAGRFVPTNKFIQDRHDHWDKRPRQRHDRANSPYHYDPRYDRELKMPRGRI